WTPSSTSRHSCDTPRHRLALPLYRLRSHGGGLVSIAADLLFRKLIELLLRLLGIRRKNDFRGELVFDVQTRLNPYMRMLWRHYMNLDVKLGDTGTHTAVYAV